MNDNVDLDGIVCRFMKNRKYFFLHIYRTKNIKAHQISTVKVFFIQNEIETPHSIVSIKIITIYYT